MQPRQSFSLAIKLAVFSVFFAITSLNLSAQFDDSDNDGLLDKYESWCLWIGELEWGEQFCIYGPLPGTDPNNPDTDGDGLLDGQEVDIYGEVGLWLGEFNTEAMNPDTDGDGLLDGQEVDTNGVYPWLGEYNTSASNPDMDNDGLLDGEEVNVYGSDPNNSDSDGDGLLDGEEVNYYGSDPMNSDSDNDGLDDGYEATHIGVGAVADSDYDDDGLSDGDEVLLYGTDPGWLDSDYDGLKDGTEVNSLGTDPMDSDTDDDGAGDGVEVGGEYGSWIVGAPGLGTDPFNPDTDNDGLLDGEEMTTSGTSPLDSDSDDDGLLDGQEGDYGSDPMVADTDSDGLLDGQEVNTYFTNPISYDTDNDELTDGDEVYIYGTDPTLYDTDSDGTGDGWEVTAFYGWATDPTIADTDMDGLLDGEEIPIGTNPLNPDTDGDGLNDSYEVNNIGYGAAIVLDYDGDGLSDYDEVMVHFTDPASTDTDYDQLSDGDEILIFFTNPLSNDSDGDDVMDSEEVLDFGTDPNNPDTDSDGVGDFLETYFNGPGTDPFIADTDGDGLDDGEELFVYSIGSYTEITDPLEPDTDNDGLLDGEEVHTYYTDPTEEDTDSDGLLDGEEVNTYLTDPTILDTDGGSVNDGVEVFQGTDPLNPGDDCLSINGCMDLAACNYNPAAVCDDGSCAYPGCTNGSACNYDSTAGCDDGSCLINFGCTDDSACNYNESATCDDGSCMTVYGCIDPLACNFSTTVTCDDGWSCTYPGCNDVWACNFNQYAGCNDGSCNYVEGCTDAAACNYDPSANCDDIDYCSYPGCNDDTACNYDVEAGCDDGSCLFTDACGNCGGIGIAGCMDASACNYNPSATCYDGSCLTVLGCTDASACNYNPAATCDDGNCNSPGCNDLVACNYNPSASCSDGSCSYSGCTDPTACNYEATAGCDDGSCVHTDAFGITSIPLDGNIEPMLNSTSDAADWNGDGFVDLVVQGLEGIFGDEKTRIYLNDGAGGWILNGNIGGGADNRAYGDVNFGDVDGDGDQDLIVSGRTDFNSGTIITSLYLNDGSGGVESINSASFTAVTNSTGEFEDVDGDGDLDYFLIGTNGSNTPFSFLYRNDGAGNYTAEAQSFEPIYEGSISFGDVDGDGDPDLITSGWISGGFKTSLYLNNGSGIFAVVAGTTFEDVRYSGSDFGDVDGDGDLDFILSGFSLSIINSTELYLNDGSGVFTKALGTPFVPVKDASVLMRDVDYDGDIDAIILGRDNGGNATTNLYVNDGTGTFELSSFEFTASWECDFTSIDVNGDGQEEVFYHGFESSNSTSELYQFKNQTLAILGCMNENACNYDSSATCDDGSCGGVLGCMDNSFCNFNPSATCDNGLCGSTNGCTNTTACNYDPLAVCDDGSCLTNLGCMTASACNYDPSANCDDGSCLTTLGCMSPNACNFDPSATCDDGSCTYPGCNDSAACNYNSNAGCNDGSCLSNYGCTDASACNYDPIATCNDGSCSAITGCMDPLACNYNSAAVCSSGSCILQGGCTEPSNCNYDPTAVCDDGSCDYYTQSLLSTLDSDLGTKGFMFEVHAHSAITLTQFSFDFNGCGAASHTYSLWTKSGTQVGYSSTVGAWSVVNAAEVPCYGSQTLESTEPFSLSMAAGEVRSFYIHSSRGFTGYDNDPVSGSTVVASDTFIDIVAGYALTGIFSPSASTITPNIDVFYNETVHGCTNPIACNYNSGATCEDGSCLTDFGCTVASACNYDPSATCDDGSCSTVYGCTNTSACNYNPLASCEDGSCLTVYGCTNLSSCNFNPLATCNDGSCLTLYGCTDALACNYNASATCDNGSCLTNYGCTNNTYCNYDPTATCDDGSCGNAVGCNDTAACNYDPLADCDDGSCLYPNGCLDPSACNYNANANCDNGICLYGGVSYFLDLYTDCWGQETGWQITNESNEVVFDKPVGSYLSTSAYGEGICLTEGCYTLTLFDSNGNGLNGSSYPECQDDGAINLIDHLGETVYGMYGENFGYELSIPFCYNPGCLDPSACNYDVHVTHDDGSCMYGEPYNLQIATDCWPEELFWDIADELGTVIYSGVPATTVDGVLIEELVCFAEGCYTFTIYDSYGDGMEPIGGCDFQGNYVFTDALGNTVFEMTNANYGFETSHYFCYELGCTDATACNYDSTASHDDGSCLLPDGCVDIAACNYDSAALCDNGFCIYGGDDITVNFDTDCWGSETSWEILDDSGNLLYSSAQGEYDDTNPDSPIQLSYSHQVCLYEGCYTFIVYDSYGDGISGGSTYATCDFDGDFQLIDGNGTSLVQMTDADFGSSTTYSFCYVIGCTAPTACNFNSNATSNDGSCMLPDGCTNPIACNYGAANVCDDGSCIIQPANDICSNATSILVDGGSLLVDNTSTCTDGPSFSCGGQGNKDLWYSFVFPGGGIRIETAAGTLSNTSLAVYDGCGGSLIACDNNNGLGSLSLLYMCDEQLNVGQTYFIQASGFSSLNGTFYLEVKSQIIPTNDVCTSATEIISNAGPVSTNNSGTCIDGPTPPCGGSLPVRDVWYKFTQALGAEITIATTTGGLEDTRIAVWDGCGQNLIACDDDSGPGNSSMLVLGCDQLLAGHEYYIQCGGQGSSSGTFDLSLTSVINSFTGCTNASACNYDPTAQCDDGSCLTVYGCMDAFACNFNSEALCDNGNCLFGSGCTDPSACNFNSGAQCDDGSCLTSGCTDSSACNYNGLAQCDDGTCLFVYGCTDPSSCNFNSEAQCDDGSCLITGCTDSSACNYHYFAQCDDGSCILAQCKNPNACNYNSSAFCHDDDACIGLSDCMDVEACNYNPSATCDDGSCVGLSGCMDVVSCNYNPTATCDDGSCAYTDAAGFNYVNLPTGPMAAGKISNSNAADVNGDGFMDLLVMGTSSEGRRIDLYINDGTGSFTSFAHPFPAMYRGTVSFGDVDGDGDQDLLLSGHATGNIRSTNLYFNDGSGNFTLSVSSVFTPVKDSSGEFADVDGDGDLDYFLIGDATTGKISSLYRNDGDGVFTAEAQDFVGLDYGTVTFGDIDGDGDYDLITSGGNTESSTSKFINDGNGIFTLVADAILDDVEFSGAEMGDVDGDGDLDYFLTGKVSGTEFSAELYTNDGSGSYTKAAGTPFVGVQFASVLMEDLDADGDLDILVFGEDLIGNKTGNLYINDGTGIFELSEVVFAPFIKGQANFVDVNADGQGEVFYHGENEFGWKSIQLYQFTAQTEAIYGCTDPMACEFDPTVTCDDGSCATAAQTYYLDDDGDSFGDLNFPVELCVATSGYVVDNTDCDDLDPLKYPGAPGTGTGVDNNCNGIVEGDELSGTCLGDLNFDGTINTADLLLFLGAFGCNSNCIADLDGNLVVNTSDLLLFLGLFGTGCP